MTPEERTALNKATRDKIAGREKKLRETRAAAAELEEEISSLRGKLRPTLVDEIAAAEAEGDFTRAAELKGRLLDQIENQNR